MPSNQINYDALAKSIMNTDPRIFSSLVISDPSGAILGEARRNEMLQNLGSLITHNSGMAGHWGILAFKAMERLDGVRTKAKYIVVGRERYNALIFPVSAPSSLMIALVFQLKTDPAELYEKVMKQFEDNTKIMTVK